MGPNIAEKWTVNADATEFVFTLRKGMKWSDGKPFTADDVVFAIEDCCKNTELFKSSPTTLTIGGSREGLAVRPLHALAQGEHEFGGVGVDGPFLGDVQGPPR